LLGLWEYKQFLVYFTYISISFCFFTPFNKTLKIPWKKQISIFYLLFLLPPSEIADFLSIPVHPGYTTHHASVASVVAMESMGGRCHVGSELSNALWAAML